MSHLRLVVPDSETQKAKKAWSDIVVCACFYCGEHQQVGKPPCFAKCSKCGHGFRVIRNWSGIDVELSRNAAGVRGESLEEYLKRKKDS